MFRSVLQVAALTAGLAWYYVMIRQFTSGGNPLPPILIAVAFGVVVLTEIAGSGGRRDTPTDVTVS